jgi:hypothetical protein
MNQPRITSDIALWFFLDELKSCLKAVSDDKGHSHTLSVVRASISR